MAHRPTYKELENRVHELERNAEIIRPALENVDLGITRINTDFEIEWVNPTVLNWFGVSIDGLIGRKCYEVFEKKNDRCSFCPISKVMETRQPAASVIEGIMPDGTTFYVKDKAFPIFNEEGEIIGFNQIIEDITKRKQVEETLQESEEKFSRAFNSNASMMALSTLEDGRFIDVNAGFLHAFGYERDEVIGKTSVELNIFFDIEQRDAIKQIVKDKECVRNYEVITRTKNGKLRYGLFSGEIIQLQKQRCWLTVLIDITDRKQVEEELKKHRHNLEKLVTEQTRDLLKINEKLRTEISERKRVEEEMQKLALAIKYSSELFNLAFLDGTMTFLNEAGIRMLGIDPAEIRRTNIMDVVPGHLSGQVENELLPALTRGESWEGELQYLNLKTGELTDVHAMTFAVKDPNTGQPQFMANISRDITETKRATEEKDKLEKQLRQAQKMEAVGTLAGGVAHDFNNSLAAILSYTELSLLQNKENTSLRSNLENIVQAVNHSKDLVKQILTFARPVTQERKPIDLRLVIAETHKFLKATLSATIEIRQNIRVKSGTILADPTQIQQVLMNLCSNAAHALREKHGLLEISLKEVALHQKDINTFPELKPGAYLRLTISDSGQGIDQENIGRIFDPYFTTKGPGEGSGMGLSVVHGFVKNHDGAIRVESYPGTGSTFQILLPKAEEEVNAITDILKPVSKAGKGTCILFVDDEKALVNAGKLMLQHLGYKVIAHTSSVEASKDFRERPDEIDLVISDMAMPDMTGLELSKELLQIRSDIPIIVCTGFSQQLSPKKTKEMGIRKMLMKPLSANELIDAIDKVLAQK